MPRERIRRAWHRSALIFGCMDETHVTVQWNGGRCTTGGTVTTVYDDDVLLIRLKVDARRHMWREGKPIPKKCRLRYVSGWMVIR